MDARIINKDPLTFAEVAEQLASIPKEEVAEIQNKVCLMAKKFSPTSHADAEKLASELEALEIIRLAPEHMVTIIDLMPSDVVELRSILAGFKTTLKPEDLTKIQEVINKYKK